MPNKVDTAPADAAGPSPGDAAPDSQEREFYGPPPPPAEPKAEPVMAQSPDAQAAGTSPRAEAAASPTPSPQPAAAPAQVVWQGAPPGMTLSAVAAPRRGRFGWLAASVGWLLRVTVIGMIIGGVALLAIWPVLQESRRIGFEVVPLGVPADLAARGLTPEVAALRLVDAIDRVRETTLESSRNRPSKDEFPPTPPFAVTPNRLSLRSLASLLREALGYPTWRIGGDVVMLADNRLGIRLRSEGMRSFAAHDGFAAENIDAMFAAAAPDVWRRANPLLYAWHVADTEVVEDTVRTKLIAIARDQRPPLAVEVRVSVLYARSLVRSGRATEAITMLEELEKRLPDYPLTWNVKAHAFVDLGRADAALEAQRRAVELEGTSVWSHLSTAQLLMKLGRAKDALVDLQAARRLNPNNFDAVLLESAALLNLGRAPEALALVARIIEARPNLPGVHEVMGNTLLANNRAEEALAYFDAEIARNPAANSSRLGRANALRALRRPEEALAVVDALLATAPRDGGSVMLRGWLLLELGSFAPSLGVFDALLSSRADNAQAIHGRALALAALGRRVDAIAALQQVVQLQPTNRRAAADLARLRATQPAAPPAAPPTAPR